jgi:hypothetical protein
MAIELLMDRQVGAIAGMLRAKVQYITTSPTRG